VVDGLAITNLALSDGWGVLGLTGVDTASIRDCHASNLIIRDGASYVVEYGVNLYRTLRCSISGLSGDVAFNGNAARLEQADTTVIDRVLSRGAIATESAVRVKACNRTLVTGSSLRNEVGGQRYAVEEEGVCTRTIVRGNLLLEGALGTTLLTGSGSIEGP
jgi:hypothetical protein